MAKTTGLNAAQLRAKIEEGKAQGLEESKSKKLGKYVDALKVLEPGSYDKGQVAESQKKLSTSTQPGGTGSVLPGGSSGVPAGQGGQPGAIDLTSIYNNALNDPALTSIEAELNAKKSARDAALADVNDNPFYTEATRVGKQAKVNAASTNEINTLQGRLDAGKAEAQIKVNLATQQYNIQNQQYQQNLQKLQTLISTGGILNATSADLAQIAVATGFTPTEIKSIQDKARSDQVKPQVMTDSSGNVTLFDGATGKVIAKVGNIGKGTGTGTGDTPINNNKLSDKDVGAAIKVLSEVDVKNYGTADKQLAPWEIQDAYNQLLQKYGNPDTAKRLLQEAINKGNFTEWK